MAGLIDDANKPEEAPVEQESPKSDAAPTSPESDGELTPEKVSASIKMPPELQEAYERVVVAGMKVMFDPKTHQMALEQLQGEGPISQRLGRAIAGMMILLFKESNNTMPPQVIIPAGTDLLVRAADFLKKSGIEQVTDEDIGEALNVMIETLLQGAGMDPAKVLNSFDASQVPEQGAAPAKGGLVDQAAGNEPQPQEPPTDEPQEPPVDEDEEA